MTARKRAIYARLGCPLPERGRMWWMVLGAAWGSFLGAGLMLVAAVEVMR